MRRSMAVVFAGLAALLAPSVTDGQAPVTMLCVAVSGPAPTIGWTPHTLAAAIQDGTAVLALVTDPASCSGAGAPTSHTLTGSVTIPAPQDGGKRTWRDDGSGGCYGVNDFERAFGLVTVQTLLGDRLADGYLEPGTIDASSGACVFEFTVLGVPPAVDYVVAFQSGKHFALQADEMDALGWRLDVIAAKSPGSWTGPGA